MFLQCKDPRVSTLCEPPTGDHPLLQTYLTLTACTD